MKMEFQAENTNAGSMNTKEKKMENARITQLLNEHASGDEHALDDLMPHVYDHLRDMAHGRMLGERAGHTLNTTALVHEAYLKLEKFDRIIWKNRNHFFAMASQIMRNILVDYAMMKKTEKRGGDRNRVTLGEADLSTEVDLDTLISIHEVLKRLESLNKRQVRVIECRYFGGLTAEETANALDISVRTVHREWNVACAWLKRELKENF
jgi:RNA polymerase sigma factor (TIGR02999 family)